MSDKPFVVQDGRVKIDDAVIKEASIAGLKQDQRMSDDALSRIRETLEDISRSLSDSGLAKAISEIDDIPDRVAALEDRIARLSKEVEDRSHAMENMVNSLELEVYQKENKTPGY